MVYRGLDPGQKVPTSLPFFDELVEGRLLVDRNPRKLVVYLQRAEGLTEIATAPWLVPASSVIEGEHLEHLTIRSGKLELGLLFMNRRHGEVAGRHLYEFAWDGKDLGLEHLYLTHFDRYLEGQQQRLHYDLKRGQMSLQRYRFSDQAFLSEEKGRIVKQKPGLEELTPEWRPPAFVER